VRRYISALAAFSRASRSQHLLSSNPDQGEWLASLTGAEDSPDVKRLRSLEGLWNRRSIPCGNFCFWIFVISGPLDWSSHDHWRRCIAQGDLNDRISAAS